MELEAAQKKGKETFTLALHWRKATPAEAEIDLKIASTAPMGTADTAAS
jgi:hypothetical protein